jgi:hypothetical protein
MNKLVWTPPCRLSFADLVIPKADMNGKVGFRAELLFPKTIKMTDLADMRAIHDAAFNPQWGNTSPAPRAFTKCFIDGNTKKQEGRKGHWILRTQASEKRPPRLVLWDGSVCKGSDMYPGANVTCLVSTFGWQAVDKQTGRVTSRGASFNLLVVKKLDNAGQPFGNFISDDEIEEQIRATMSVADGEELLG